MERFEEIGSLYRYYLRADRMLVHLGEIKNRRGWLSKTVEAVKNGVIRSNRKLDEEEIMRLALFQEGSIYLFLGYSLLYPVVEGYRQLKLSEPEIDALLQSPNVRLLKDFRDSNFHYQRQYEEKRLLKLLEEPELERWIRALHRSLGKYLYSISMQLLAEKQRTATPC